jgi:hypothetical protein
VTRAEWAVWNPVERLLAEIDDLLDVSSVGLYEFIWILRTTYPGTQEKQLRQWARDALAQLIASGEVRLVLLQWPSQDPVGVPSTEITDGDWADPQAGVPYVAVDRD